MPFFGKTHAEPRKGMPSPRLPEAEFKTRATSHEELDGDEAIQEEVRNAARTLAEAVGHRELSDVG